jgi:hypothetical protein
MRSQRLYDVTRRARFSRSTEPYALILEAAWTEFHKLERPIRERIFAVRSQHEPTHHKSLGTG